MTDPRGRGRGRRVTRRPGSGLLTALLVLAIVASSALVFTDRVELLKLAVVLALWAAAAAAFVSLMYRRQADADQARVRDLKTVYNLQLDREISARREYELSVESHLRRELAAELRAQSADEVGALRSELAALRAHLEILFDTDLDDRPALGTSERVARAERVIASRIDTEDRRTEEAEPKTEESPIIDVAAEPHPGDEDWQPQPAPQSGAHRRAHDPIRSVPPIVLPAAQSEPSAAPQPAPNPMPQPAPAAHWRPVQDEGQWIPAGAPGSNWVSAQERGADPTMTLPPVPAPPRRHRSHEAESPAPPPPPPVPAPRHRSIDEEPAQGGHHGTGQSAAELLARLQVDVGEGGRRRRHED